MTLLQEGELLTHVYEFVAPIVEAARNMLGGPLPSMKTTEFLDADPLVKLATLLVVAEAYLVEDPHQVIREELRMASNDVHGDDDKFWSRWAANRIPFEELRRRRGVTAA